MEKIPRKIPRQMGAYLALLVGRVFCSLALGWEEFLRGESCF